MHIQLIAILMIVTLNSGKWCSKMIDLCELGEDGSEERRLQGEQMPGYNTQIGTAVYCLDFFDIHTNNDILIMIQILNDTDPDTFTTKCQHILYCTKENFIFKNKMQANR